MGLLVLPHRRKILVVLIVIMEQIVGGDPEGPAELHQIVGIRQGTALFPTGYRLPGYTQPVCQLLLGKSMGFALGCDLFR